MWWSRPAPAPTTRWSPLPWGARDIKEGTMKRFHLLATAAAAIILGLGPTVSAAQNLAAAPDHPAVTVQGQTYTPRSVLARNMGTPEDQTTAFPPHKIIDNLYYVGTRTLSSFLVVTPQGNILIDS